jgi:hypothetical protein
MPKEVDMKNTENKVLGDYTESILPYEYNDPMTKIEPISATFKPKQK